MYAILDDIWDATETEVYKQFRARLRTKVRGAATVEVIRSHLCATGLCISPRDVYMSDIPTEFDLLAVRRSARPRCGIIYDPADVKVVFEIKFYGVWGKEAVQELQERFAKVKAKHGHIQCVYITVLERKNFKYCVTSESLGAKAFTLYWVDNKDRVHEVADSRESVVEWVRSASPDSQSP